MKLVDDVFYTDVNEELKRLSSLNVFISTNVQETFSDWPDDESNAIILFFIGCEHHCVNCHNSCLSKIPKSEINYWSKEFKLFKNHINHYEFFKEQFKTRKFVRISSIDTFERFIIELCEKYNTNKIIFQGGDPLYKYNKDVVELILERFRSKYNDKYNFCIYTGYEIEKVKELLGIYPDFIKCGTFEQDLYQNPGKDKEKLVFASTNQELYDKDLNKLSNKGIYYLYKSTNEKEVSIMSDKTENVVINNGIVVENEMKNAFEPTAKTARTLGNIKHVVERTLKEKYGIDNTAITETLLKIHGLNTKQFDFVSCVENDLNEDVLNDASIDPNANKCEKTIESLMVEASNPAKKAIGYDMLYRQMKNDYGKEEAKRLSGEMYSFALALADATKILSCYCYSIDASILVKKGRDFGQLHSKPCKRLCSYISSLCETIHQMSNHLAGAIAVGTFFMDCAHVLMFTDNNGEGYTLEQIKTDKEIRKMIENEYQQFVHSVNHLSRNASESPFSNISIFDRPKLKTLLSGEGMPEYFEGKDIEYVIDYIMELQKIFVEFFDKGDVLSEGMPYRFPVVTCNFSKDEKEAEVLDEEFLDYMVEKDIYRYNIFTSTGTKVASCCFRGSDLVKVRDPQNNEITMTFKELSERDVTGYKILRFDTWEEFENVKVPYTDDWVIVVTKDGSVNHYTKDHLLHTIHGDIPAIELKLNDSLILNKNAVSIEGDKNYVEIKSIYMTINTDGVAYCVRMKDQSNPYFTLPNGVITHNCRLINDVDLMKDLGSQSNSFGGVGISLGSHRVVTINFNRIALEANTYKEYKEILVQRIEDAAKILASHKRLLVHLTEKGYQLFIKNGWIRMDRLFSTFGVLGLVEVENTIKSKGGFEDLSNDIDIIGESLKILDQKMFEVSKKYGIMGNIEQIPGESMAIRLSKADKLLYGDQKVPYKLYANQFVPLWKKASLWEKLSADGKYNKMITGGGIVHAQIGERVTPAQAKKIIKYAIKSGCEHFALNAVYTKCNNGHTSFGNHSVCPHCGSQFLKHYTRVVGFFTEVENWAPERRVWEFPNRTYVDVNNIGNPESSEEIVKSTPKTTEESVCETCRINTESVKEEKTITKFFDEKYLDLSFYTTHCPDFVFFYRSKCPKCHEFVEKHFEEIKAAGKTITCIRVNDSDKENIALAAKYGIKTTPTLIYNKEGTFENSVSTQFAKNHVLGDTENEQIFTIEEVLKMGLEK